MLLAGAGGHALELADVLRDINYLQHEVFFFDDVNTYNAKKIGDIILLTSLQEVADLFKQNNKYALATGNPRVRKLLSDKLNSLGGSLTTIISSSAKISNNNVSLQNGINVMHYCLISANVSIGEGTLINAYTSVHHDVEVGSFTEIAPGCRILGGVVVGDDCFIGCGAVVLPKIKIGTGAKVGAGAVVTRDVEPGATVVGIPARQTL